MSRRADSGEAVCSRWKRSNAQPRSRSESPGTWIRASRRSRRQTRRCSRNRCTTCGNGAGLRGRSPSCTSTSRQAVDVAPARIGTRQVCASAERRGAVRCPSCSPRSSMQRSRERIAQRRAPSQEDTATASPSSTSIGCARTCWPPYACSRSTFVLAACVCNNARTSASPDQSSGVTRHSTIASPARRMLTSRISRSRVVRPAASRTVMSRRARPARRSSSWR